MARAATPGEHIRLRVRVLDGDGLPVDDAMIELWQADANGTYAVRQSGAKTLRARSARIRTSRSSRRFSGIRPPRHRRRWLVHVRDHPAGSRTDPLRAPEAPHIDVCLFARGLLRHLYTRIYFDADPALGDDSLLSLVPADRRETLLARRTSDASTWEFIVRLQGAGETVFFDV